MRKSPNKRRPLNWLVSFFLPPPRTRTLLIHYIKNHKRAHTLCLDQVRCSGFFFYEVDKLICLSLSTVEILLCVQLTSVYSIINQLRCFYFSERVVCFACLFVVTQWK